MSAAPISRTWHAFSRAWGVHGNDRLTASVGLVLLVLLAVEAWTTLSLRSYLPLHMFLGFVLLPPVALKLSSVGWRAARYYAGSREYRLAGPPNPLLRVLAPLLVASTLALFASGVALVFVGHGRGWIQTVHAASFVVWGVLMIVHVAAYLPRVLRSGTADWSNRMSRAVPGARTRRALLVGALLAGAVIALATYHAQQAFHPKPHGGSHVRLR